MRSLSYLNGVGTTSITVTDNRPAKVNFDRNLPVLPTNQVFTINTGTVTVNPGIQITEIINYATANCRYRVKIVTGGTPLLTGSTISWGTLPSGVTLTTVGSTYTLSGINTVAIWDAIKQFTWNLPSNRESSPLWYLDVAVVYYDGVLGKDVERNWLVYDDRFYYVAMLEATFTQAFDGDKIRAKLFNATIGTSFTMVANADKIKGGIADLSATFSMTAIGDKNPIVMLSNATVVCDAEVLILSRNYISNNANKLFNVGYISDIEPSASFTIKLTCNFGGFSSDPNTLPVSPWEYTGTQTQVNAIMLQIKFYPDKNASANGTFTYQRKKNTSVQVTQTVDLYGTSGSFTTRTYTFNSSGTYRPTAEEYIYGVADALIVGAGGGGGGSDNNYTTGGFNAFRLGGGGGGGGVQEILGITLSLQDYPVVVGLGGLGGSVDNNRSPANGTNTSVFGYTSSGGLGATNAVSAGYAGWGGNSGAPTTHAGYVDTYVGYYYGGNGGGAGANQTGTQTSSGHGGNGLLSTITGLYYGGGGGGGAAGGSSGTLSIRQGALGGTGGGGQGGGAATVSGYIPPQPGLPNTGGGGGGAGVGGTIGIGIGSFSGTVMTITSVSSGAFAYNQILTGSSISTPYIVNQITSAAGSSITHTNGVGTTGSNTITVDSPTLIKLGHLVSGNGVTITGIPAGTTVIGIAGNVITLSNTLTANINTEIYFYVIGGAGTYTISKSLTLSSRTVTGTSPSIKIDGQSGGSGIVVIKLRS